MHASLRLPLYCLFFCLPLAVAGSIAFAGPAAGGGSGGVNAAAQRDKPYVVLVSVDGYRWDYLDRYPTPALGRLAANGVRAASLVPVYPTLTFPNHFSIATGLYPAEHGLVGNDFPDAERRHWYRYKDRSAVQDPRWYGGEPVWVSAERAGLVSAAYFFVGTEAAVGGVAPSHWRAFDASVSGTERVDQALAWLALPASRRPHLVTLYFEQVDEASHRFGPESAENAAAIRAVDGYLQRLLDGIAATPRRDDTYVVIVSDHGQAAYGCSGPPLVLDTFLDPDAMDVSESGPLAFLYLRDRRRAAAVRDAVNRRWTHGRAWLPDGAPAAWRLAPDPRMADVILQADAGCGVMSSPATAYKMTPGDHGWAPGVRDMHGIFVAAGPDLPAGVSIDSVGAVEVYPLLLGMLGLPDRRLVRHPSRLADLLESTVPSSRSAADSTDAPEADR